MKQAGALTCPAGLQATADAPAQALASCFRGAALPGSGPSGLGCLCDSAPPWGPTGSVLPGCACSCSSAARGLAEPPLPPASVRWGSGCAWLHPCAVPTQVWVTTWGSHKRCCEGRPRACAHDHLHVHFFGCSVKRAASAALWWRCLCPHSLGPAAPASPGSSATWCPTSAPLKTCHFHNVSQKTGFGPC